MGLGAAVGNQGPQYVQGLKQEQQQMSDRKRQEIEYRQKAMYQDGYQAFNMLADGNIDGIINLANDRLEMLGTFPDADPSDTMRILSYAEAAKAGDPTAIRNLSMELSSAARTAQALGIVKPQAPEIVKGGDMYRGQVVTRDPITGAVTMTSPEGMDSSNFIDPDEQKEARTYIRGNVKQVNDNLAEIAGSYSKVVSLEDQMRSGDRGAINAAIMNVARLISPGVVTDNDARALSGTDTNIGAVFNFLQGKGFDTNQLLKIYDPTNPEVFSVDNLMNMAKSITASSIPTYQNQLADMKTMSDTYDLSQQFSDSFFNKGELSGQIEGIMASLSGGRTASPQGGGSQSFSFNSEAEANAAIANLPVGATVQLPNGETFVVEEN